MSELSESGRNCLLYLGDLFRGGFTGKVELECKEGGVREIKPTPYLRGPHFGRGPNGNGNGGVDRGPSRR